MLSKLPVVLSWSCTMPDSDILIFDIIALEWLIALLTVAVFIIVGGFVDRGSRRELRSLVAKRSSGASPRTPGNDGEITITATSTASDSSKYEYSIDNGANYQVSNVFGGLSAGTYNFLVRHVDTGCIVTATETLAEPNTFTIDVVKTSDVICYGTDTGEVTFELVDATYTGGFDWTVYSTPTVRRPSWAMILPLLVVNEDRGHQWSNGHSEPRRG